MKKTIMLSTLLITLFQICTCYGDVKPWEIDFSRQGVMRPVLDEGMDILLSELNPEEVVGLGVMYPVNELKGKSDYRIVKDKLEISSKDGGESMMWAGGCNPFACYSIDLAGLKGSGSVGAAFASRDRKSYVNICLTFANGEVSECRMIVNKDGRQVADQKLSDSNLIGKELPGRFYVQMLGSGFTCFIKRDGLPVTIGQGEYNQWIDLREKDKIHSWHFVVMSKLAAGSMVEVSRVKSAISAGVGLADLRAVTYQDGRPYMDEGRLWYTISIRGRQLPHHVQGVFSMDASVFDLKLEGIIVFDRGDGLLRNEIASHIFYDETVGSWRGLTTGFSSYAMVDHKDPKQIWAVESDRDPRFGMVVMKAKEMQLVGNYEDAHIIYDKDASKWRMLLCENTDGPYRAVVRESDRWDGGYKKIAGPVGVDSTGTQIQKIGDSRYCMFGSADRCMYVFSYPGLKQLGKLQLDLPPWDERSGTRVWTNVVPLPEGYPARYVALTMDRFNYPGIKGANWSYGALYLYHGQGPDGDGQEYEY